MNDTTTYTFIVTGMHRAGCGKLIDTALEELPGVHRSQTSCPPDARSSTPTLRASTPPGGHPWRACRADGRPA
jgi:copper chaperone CopZ